MAGGFVFKAKLSKESKGMFYPEDEGVVPSIETSVTVYQLIRRNISCSESYLL